MVRRAVLQWNKGTSSREQLMTELGIPPGTFSMEHHDREDFKRVERPVEIYTEHTKRRRKHEKLAKIRQEEPQKGAEGPFYTPGGF